MSDDAPFEYPRKIVSGAALLLDQAGRLLIVNPTYHSRWEIPGGLAEQGESPSAAARREIAEELGLRIAIGPLLCVEWRPPIPRGPGEGLDGLHFIFEGGVLSEEAIASIRLQEDELAEYALLPPAEALERLPLRLAARVSAALSARPAGPPVYLEAGSEHGVDEEGR
jgi:8-oxo-dGTP diphosphatase